VVRSGRELDAFVRLQQQLYASDPHYVPPIVAERREFLDPEKNPFFTLAARELFLARDAEGRLVGRIAAVDDTAYNQFYNTQRGFFGMFDCVDDPAVASVLLDAAAAWVRARGMTSLMGPVNLSLNHDCGLLVEGFDTPPCMMMSYNARYYAPLLEGWGLKRAQDLLSYEVSTGAAPPEKVVRVAERARERDDVTVRALDMKDLPGEVRRLKAVYNAMLEQRWGFVPMSEEEFDYLARRLKPLVALRPELCRIAEVHGEPVAFSLTLPDANVAIKQAGGQLTTWGLPIGAARIAWAVQKVDRLRVLLFGIRPGYRKRGLDALLYLDTLRIARERGYVSAELGWVTDDNAVVNRSLELMGARRIKTYRLYEKRL
jgi:GNAT superfamily N-acetyltransferase